MTKNHSYNENDPNEFEELEDDPELKELGNEDLEDKESTKNTEEDDILEQEEL